MKHKSLYFIYIARGLFLIGLVLVVLSFKSSFTHTQHVAYSFDARIAAPTVKKIKVAIQDLIQQHATPKYISNYLIVQWPCIEKVAIANTLPKTVHVTISARTAWARVNEQMIATTDGMLVDKRHLVASCYDTLPTIKVPQAMAKEKNLNADVMSALTKCYNLLSCYDLVFHNDTHILLYDRQDPRFAIVCCVTQLPDQWTIERCNRIRQDLIQQGKFNERLSRVWLVDTRFANQIIVSADHGGEVYGANCV